MRCSSPEIVLAIGYELISNEEDLIPSHYVSVIGVRVLIRSAKKSDGGFVRIDCLFSPNEKFSWVRNDLFRLELVMLGSVPSCFK